jgi:hypothetical protein
LRITLAGIIMAGGRQLNGAVVQAKSASLGDVESAIGSAQEGDTVMVPAGTANWSSTLLIRKGITLKGATSVAGSLSDPVVTDETIILDELPRRSPQNRTGRQGSPGRQQASPEGQQGFRGRTAGGFRGGGFARGQGRVARGMWAGPNFGRMPAIINAVLKPTQSFRLSGFTFKYGSATTYADDGGVHLAGACPTTRIDHCHFDQLYANPFIMTRGQIYGVVDHCVFDERPRAQTFQVYHDGWDGYTHGDGSWADNTYFGTEKFLFIEDNTFRNAKGYKSNGIDAYGGARYVARHNYLVDTPIGGHGTESSGRFRGIRALEVYNNTCVWSSAEPRGQLRSGTMVEFNNVWTGKEDRLAKSTRLTCYREFQQFPFWGAANGNNRLDSNDPHGLYATGKHTGENNSATLIVANAAWKVNQWVGYSVTNTTRRNPRTGAHPSSYVTANTSDTITIAREEAFGGPNLTFNNGETYEIYKLLVALDQPGRGKGDLLVDKDPMVTGSWPRQALEPAYAWGNTYNNVRQLDLASGYPTIKKNRDFYNQETPFDGRAGIGVGSLAERPKGCTPGVAYWATDQGEWDNTHAGPDGQLYICTMPNTWSLYYRPYTYPHPFVQEWPPVASGKGGRGK